MKSIEKVFCGRMDHGGCGLLAEIKDGRIVGIKGDPDSYTRGYICPKGRAHIERLYHPLKKRGRFYFSFWLFLRPSYWLDHLFHFIRLLKVTRKYFATVDRSPMHLPPHRILRSQHPLHKFPVFLPPI
jgi:hypothetical protein